MGVFLNICLINHGDRIKGIAYSLIRNAEDAEEIILHRTKLEALGAMIDTLSEEQREVILLKYMNHLTNPEIAELLGESLTVITSRLNRAQETINKSLFYGKE